MKIGSSGNGIGMRDMRGGKVWIVRTIDSMRQSGVSEIRKGKRGKEKGGYGQDLIET